VGSALWSAGGYKLMLLAAVMMASLGAIMLLAARYLAARPAHG
jgi:hypothetical protein